jgi:lipopolysaccharide/colanic/teichoic acid biosynthesis glycosyltransferase
MLKKLFDITVVIIFMPLIIIFLILISFYLLIKQGKPIFFVQNRVGKDNKSFKLYKFRTMEITAEEDFHKSHYLDLAKGKTVEPTNSPLEPIRIENDDRITTSGAFLRKASLDELPNVFNVLLGDMSIVGPRPLVDYESELYGDYNLKRCSVLPGITGLAQIQGRLDLSLQERLYWDIKYIEDKSFLNDLKIIYKTVASVLSRKGAN